MLWNMLQTRSHFVLGVLLLLTGAVHGNAPQLLGFPECRAQAWVRAPDLTPNAIVHGEVRVKISTECPDVDSVLLGLRFKERSFVKALRSREDSRWLRTEPSVTNLSDRSPWAAKTSRFANRTAQEAYEEIITNKDLWVVREEERLVFETTHPIHVVNRNHGVLRDVVQDFSILVPSTNFPAILNTFTSGFSIRVDAHEMLGVEWMYEYFAQVSFSNGMMREISAGYTAFQQAVHDLASTSPLSETTQLEHKSFRELAPSTNYSIEISLDSDLFAGTKNHLVTVFVTRTGPARTFSAPLDISLRVTPRMTPKWASEYGLLDTTLRTTVLDTPSVLHVPSGDGKQPSRIWNTRPKSYKGTVWMPNSTLDEIETNAVVTTSGSTTISIDVDEDHLNTFEMYYQTLSNSLTVTLETPCAESELVDPDEPSDKSVLSSEPLLEDDEEEWVPWKATDNVWRKKFWKSYTGHVPVVVHPSMDGMPSEHCSGTCVGTSEQVILSGKESRLEPSVTHYLAENARGPIFVTKDAIPYLLAEDPVERQLHAPILEPVVSSLPKGEELIYRYYSHHFRKGSIYVGKTWAKKMTQV